MTQLLSPYPKPREIKRRKRTRRAKPISSVDRLRSLALQLRLDFRKDQP